MNDYSESDSVLEYVSYYRFRSEKSKLFYIVRVEAYHNHIYGIKFFLKSMINSPRKYSHLTNTFEPRTIVYSVFHLMMDIFKDDRLASFMFIGNPDEGCNHINTRRYRLYCKLVSNRISDRFFKHIRTPRYSLYILANREMMSDDPFFSDKLLEEFVARFIIEEPNHEGLVL